MKKITIILILIIISIFLCSKVILAYNLELILSSDKNNVKVGDKVTITLSLSKGMQAADFTINYDSSLLQFENTSLGKNFYAIKEPGKINCSWFDTNDTTSFTFTFVAISSGTAKFTTNTENFYDRDLKAASAYNEGSLNITLLSSTNLNETPLIPNNNQQNNVQNNEQETIKEETNNNTQSTDNNVLSTNNDIPSINDNSSSTLKSTSSTYSENNNSASSNTSLPQTGDSTMVFIYITIILTILAVIFKIKWNNLRDI